MRLNTDVAIIGGGITGCSLLYYLANKGVKVVLLEKNSIGHGSSTACPDMSWFGIHYYYTIARKIFGISRARDIWALTLENRKLLQQLAQDCHVKCEKKELAIYPSNLEEEIALAESASLMKNELSVNSVMREIDGIKCYFFQDALSIKVLDILNSIKKKYPDNVVENYAVLRIEANSGGLKLHTSDSYVSCELAVVAADFAILDLVDFFDGIVFPMKQNMYSIPTSATTGVFNSYKSIVNKSRIWSFAKHDAVKSVFPDAVSVSSRTVAFSCDEIPCVGPIPGTVNLFASVGYQGCELNLATVCAKMTSDIILTGKSDFPISLFNIRRHI